LSSRNGAEQLVPPPQGGRINVELVQEEIARLAAGWADSEAPRDETLLLGLLGPERLAEIDRFDRVQLAEAVRVCGAARSLAEAGRALFAASRERKKLPNDADRIRKYLGRFGLVWADLQRAAASSPGG
jgi:transcriptional regulatory protein RtcR